MRLLLLSLISIFLFVSPALAKIGVGVATGKIVVDEILHPGTIYQLPPLSVLNTGDEDSAYTVDVAFQEKQAELMPQATWFSFKPTEFDLKPGESQVVEITLSVPVKVEPGKYFAYLEGLPLKKSESGATSIGIAAAAKLYFEVAAANIFVGLYYRAITYWSLHQPLLSILTVILVIWLIGKILGSRFNFSITKKTSGKNE